MSNPIDLSGKVAIITGASSGIGKATAVTFSQLAAKLAIAGRDMKDLEETKEECEKNGAKVLAIPGDVTKEDDNKKLVTQTIEHFGQLDILVNNAGTVKSGAIETTTLADYDLIMNVNLRSVFQLTQLAIPHLIKTKGCIINNSSLNGHRSFPDLLAYSLSKAGLDQLTRCAALELADRGIRVNAVCPGVIKTDILKNAGMTEEQYAKVLEHSKTTHPLGRHGQSYEVSSTIAFLASGAASFITGVTLPIDGGWGVTCPR